MDAQVMFQMTFCSSGLLGNKQLSTKVVSKRKITKVCFKGCASKIIDAIKFIFPQLQLEYISGCLIYNTGLALLSEAAWKL